jgi:isochorismate pyruvate lyase
MVAKKSDGVIEMMRGKIDSIDSALLQLIAKRKEVALEIAKLKQKSGTADDEARLMEVLKNIQAQAKRLGLDEAEMKALWKSLIAYMIREQMKKYPR